MGTGDLPAARVPSRGSPRLSRYLKSSLGVGVDVSARRSGCRWMPEGNNSRGWPWGAGVGCWGTRGGSRQAGGREGPFIPGEITGLLLTPPAVTQSHAAAWGPGEVCRAGSVSSRVLRELAEALAVSFLGTNNPFQPRRDPGAPAGQLEGHGLGRGKKNLPCSQPQGCPCPRCPCRIPG